MPFSLALGNRKEQKVFEEKSPNSPLSNWKEGEEEFQHRLPLKSRGFRRCQINASVAPPPVSRKVEGGKNVYAQ